MQVNRTLAIMRRFLGSLTLLFSVLMFVGAIWTGSNTPKHNVSSTDHEHLEAAVNFVREWKNKTGAIPESEEFNKWAKTMDSNGSYRFDGRGYTLYKQCGSNPAEFCINFWTGEEFVTYRSLQDSTGEVSKDHPPYLSVLGFLFAGLLGGTVATFLMRGSHK
jgi:hypothetical protein